MSNQFPNLRPRLTSEELIRRADREREQAVLDALNARYSPDRRRIVNWVFAVFLGLAIVGCAALVLFLAR